MSFPPSDKVLPTVLQKAEVSILTQTQCKKSYGPVTSRMLCAGVPSGERDACRVRSHLTLVPHSPQRSFQLIVSLHYTHLKFFFS